MFRMLKVFGNDDVESTFTAGNIGKERQKILKFPKQLISVFCCKSNRFPIPIVDVEQRSCTSASHLNGRDIDENSIDFIPEGFRIGVTNEIGLPQITKMLNMKIIARIIGNDSSRLVFVK